MANKIFPSVVAKNQKELNKIFKKMEGVAKELHLDIVDGKFAPNNSLDFKFKLSKNFKYNAHLMINNPEAWIKRHGNKVEFYSVHVESLKNVAKYIADTKKKKKKVVFALLPETKIVTIKPYVKFIDIILVLTVHPGFYGSRYISRNLKIKKIKKLNPKITILVDGHMDPKTIKKAKVAGADWFVSGSFIQKADDPKEAIKELKRSIKS
jgi:ribulose-phosphate 3-epimerase